MGCASFKPFWPLALVQQAQSAIVFVVRGLCGHFRFCALGLTRRSSRPAYCGRLILSVRCHCAAAPPPCCISMEIYYASNADRKKWNLPNWLFCSGKYVRAKCKCKTSHPKKRNLSNWLECTGQLLRSKFEQSKNCHPKKWNLSHRL